MRTSIYFIFLCAACYLPGHAQILSPTILSAAGDVNSTDHVQLEWTLGELAVESTTGLPHSYTEGFHQPYLSITPVREITSDHDYVQAEWDANVSVAPNPVMSRLIIQLKKELASDFRVQLSDAQGQVIYQQSFSKGDLQNEIDFSAYASGMYILSFQSLDGTPHHAYKISKIQ